MNLEQFQLSHMNGAGNSFLILNNLSGKLVANKEERQNFAKKVCSTLSGLSADGFIILDPTASGLDFQWDFYNSDGSFAEMCGNAARCVTRYYFEKVGEKETVRFQTAAGEIQGRRRGQSEIEVTMPKLAVPGQFIELSFSRTQGEFYFVNTGVPHLVVEGEPVADAALVLRKAPQLAPAGANVTFFEEENPGTVTAVTFERGVDDFTLACGTGAVAAAAFAREKNPFLKRFQIEMPGGTLTVEWISADQATLSGPAQFDFDISLPWIGNKG